MENNINDDPIFAGEDEILTTDVDDADLVKLAATTEKIKRLKESDIEFAKALINCDVSGVIYPNTIVMIQGPAAAHKSRLAEILSALLISEKRTGFLNFNLLDYDKKNLCYIDTERNIKDQFPYALQKIQTLAGYKKSDNPSNFFYTSFVEINREDRLPVLIKYVEQVRKEVDGLLVIVLDVVTDFVSDFNKAEESLTLIDWMNKMINENSVTFIVLIHENPGSNKARGHVGTELLNKSSTAIQIAPDNTLDEDLGIYKISFLKNRTSKRPPPFHVIFDEVVGTLTIVDPGEVKLLKAFAKEKAPVDELIKSLSKHLLENKLSKTELFTRLRKEFETSDRTLKDRLDLIILSKLPIVNDGAEVWILTKSNHGREIYYYLIELTVEVGSDYI